MVKPGASMKALPYFNNFQYCFAAFQLLLSCQPCVRCLWSGSKIDHFILLQRTGCRINLQEQEFLEILIYLSFSSEQKMSIELGDVKLGGSLCSNVMQKYLRYQRFRGRTHFILPLRTIIEIDDKLVLAFVFVQHWRIYSECLPGKRCRCTRSNAWFRFKNSTSWKWDRILNTDGAEKFCWLWNAPKWNFGTRESCFPPGDIKLPSTTFLRRKNMYFQIILSQSEWISMKIILLWPISAWSHYRETFRRNMRCDASPIHHECMRERWRYRKWTNDLTYIGF